MDKSNFILFHPAQRKTAAAMNFYVNQTSFNEKDNMKYLGITLDKYFSWKKYIQSISKEFKKKYQYFILCKF